MNLAELGRRAVACPRWRWMPGMLLLWKLHERGGTYEGRVCHLGDSDSGAGKDVYCEGRGDRFDGVLEVPKCFPDLSDPATLGCLLHLVREAWSACRISLCFSAVTPNTERTWVVPVSYLTERDEIKNESFYGRTHGEALVAALEAAP